jgi:glutathione S-transferase
MELYWHPFSVFPRRVQIVLREKGIDCEEVVVDLPGGGLGGAEFRRLNPFGQVPVLRHGETVISESIAILEYLEESHPDPALMPAGANARALTRQLMLWSGDYLAPAWKAWMAALFDPGMQRGDPAVLKGRDDIAAHLDVLGERLGGARWLAGEFSLADVCYAPFVTTFGMIGLDDLLSERAAVRDWVDRLSARPSVRDTTPTPP